MTKTNKAARPAADVARRPAWTPRKISFATRYPTPSGGAAFGRLSLPAISMHIAACREKGKDFILHDRSAA